MTERAVSLLKTFGLPLLLAAMAVGAAKLELRQKEDAAAHALDIQSVRAQEAADVMKLDGRDEEQRQLLLDILCSVKPEDRRCK